MDVSADGEPAKRVDGIDLNAAAEPNSDDEAVAEDAWAQEGINMATNVWDIFRTWRESLERQPVFAKQLTRHR
jgi:hypothetical protein